MISDEMLRAAAASSCDLYISSLETDYDPENEHGFSSDFEGKMKKLIRKAKHPHLRMAAQRVAAVFLAILLGMGVWLATDNQARATISRWFREISETSIIYKFTGDATEGSLPKFRVKKLPKGYQEELVQGDEYLQMVLYTKDGIKDQNGIGFTFFKMHKGINNILLGEAAEIVEVYVNGLKGSFYLDAGEDEANALVWIDEEQGICFSLIARRSMEELVKMAESVYIAKK